jgi:hypothetical protein
LCGWIVYCVDDVRAMPLTNSSLLGIASTSLEAALFQICSMCDANSSLHELVGTSLKDASFPHCAMRDAYSSFDGTIVTTFVAASLLLHLGAVSDTDSSFPPGIRGTPLKAALFVSHHRVCAMSPTHSSLLSLIGTPLKAASFLLHLCTMRDTNSSPNH